MAALLLMDDFVIVLCKVVLVLSGIDANNQKAGDQVFNFTGAQAFNHLRARPETS